MTLFKISLSISNKKAVGDHEGAALLRDLTMRKKEKSATVNSISSSKVLNFFVESNNPKSAKKQVLELSRESNVYLPMVNTIRIHATPVGYLSRKQLLDLKMNFRIVKQDNK